LGFNLPVLVDLPVMRELVHPDDRAMLEIKLNTILHAGDSGEFDLLNTEASQSDGNNQMAEKLKAGLFNEQGIGSVLSERLLDITVQNQLMKPPASCSGKRMSY